MSTESDVRDGIDRAADAVGRAWPLHSFVTANPLSGFEDRPFHEAVRAGERLFSARGYPSAATFRRAWADGRIDPDALDAELAARGYDAEPETILDRLGDAETDDAGDGGSDATDRVDRVLTKWLAAFSDQGRAHWPMPDRDQGFYAAVRRLARHDREIPDAGRLTELSDDPAAAVAELLAPYPDADRESIFAYHLAALPGWTAFVRGRIDDGSAWQSAYPITLAGYLAIRLAVCDAVDAPMTPPDGWDGVPDRDANNATADATGLCDAWLSAWEATYRRELVDVLTDASAAVGAENGDTADADGGRPDAQLVFCIDTRSEIIRRHVEAAGDYETHGFAGFFGIPMEYEGYDADLPVAAHPPILDADHRIAERPVAGRGDAARTGHDRWSSVVDAGADLVDGLAANAATAFSFVESAAVGYWTALTARTLLPARVHGALDAVDRRVPDSTEFCAPAIDSPDGDHDHDGLPRGLTLDAKVEYAASAFELMGWEEFARLAVFVGHASETANNPFDSGLDCGACAGNPGGPNARVLATICNDGAVRAALRDRGVAVPEDTVFVAAEHNTTTDEIELYDADVPASHRDDLDRLRADLATARAGAAAERAGDMGADADAESGVRETRRRAADWAETRPEWGLAGNAAFVIGPRALTEGADLDGRAFLHSYDWRTDPEGDALAAIVAGPMVVTQWINAQYYFATTDTAAYGSGSKITHNPVGNVGVYQGNGGDLLPGLPTQSVMATDDEPYHQPLRLSTVIHAPVDRVTEILSAQDHLRGLLDNDWLSLTVVDPQQDHGAFRYAGGLEWTPLTDPSVNPSGPPVATADDD